MVVNQLYVPTVLSQEIENIGTVTTADAANDYVVIHDVSVYPATVKRILITNLPSGTAGAWTMLSTPEDVVKATDTTLANDATMQFSMVADKIYTIRGHIFYDGATGDPDFSWTLDGPASPTLVRFSRAAIAPGATAFSDISVETAYGSKFTVLSTTGTGGYVTFQADITNGTNAGTFAFQWAQNTSTADNLTLRAGSYIEWQEVG